MSSLVDSQPSTLTLDYRLEANAAEAAKAVDMALVDSVALRYRLFPGDVIVLGHGVDLSTRWGWVQILDFALSLKAIESTLARDGVAHFEFTESDAVLDFRVDGDDVRISSSYAPGELRVSATEFRTAVRRFARRVVHDLCEQHLRLAANPEIRPHLKG